MGSRQETNRRLLHRLLLAAGGMFLFGFLLVPIYDVFCEVTGLNGKPSVAAVGETTAGGGRAVTLQLLGSVNEGLPWSFEPRLPQLEVRTGRAVEVVFAVQNRSDRPVTGQAVPSISPGLAARHVRKIECFCFERQTLAPGERREMPVRLVIGGDLPEEIPVVSLSYTFFPAKDG